MFERIDYMHWDDRTPHSLGMGCTKVILHISVVHEAVEDHI
jgi:hypothetical protein